jgi:hypothetical protein
LTANGPCSKQKKTARRIYGYIQNTQASIDPMILKIEVQMPLGRLAGTALPVNVADGAVADEVLLPAPMALLDDA